MLKLVGFFFKLATFAALILVLGNWIEWDGKTISDQVRLKMSHAERSPAISSIRHWAEKITHDAHKGIQRKLDHTTDNSRSTEEEEILPSERQKLKALIRELNGSHKRN